MSNIILPKDPKLVIFDVDDVMWYLNERVAQIKGIDFNKFTMFSVPDNPLLTEEEKQIILNAYKEVETYKNIQFIQPVVDLINNIYHNYPEYPVRIVSNNYDQAVKDVKMEQLLQVLDLPEDQIHLRLTTTTSELNGKKLPDEFFLFVDDSPHNIVKANAMHKVMPARLHNNVLVNGCLNGCKVDRPLTDVELVKTVMDYIQKGK